MTTSSSRGPRQRRMITQTSAPEGEAAEPTAKHDGETLPAPQIPTVTMPPVLASGGIVPPGHVLVRGRGYPMADAVRLGLIEPETPEPDDGAP